MNITVTPGWNKVTDPKSLWFGLLVWVNDPTVFPGKDTDHVSVMTSDDAPMRQFHKSQFN